jgi:hypothetical protein
MLKQCRTNSRRDLRIRESACTYTPIHVIMYDGRTAKMLIDEGVIQIPPRDIIYNRVRYIDEHCK